MSNILKSISPDRADPKRKNFSVDKVALIYVLTSWILYTIISISMGRITSIFSVFFQNIVNDLYGDTARNLTHTMLSIINSENGSTMDGYHMLTYAILRETPAILQFCCIDTFVLKFIHGKGILTKFLSYLGGYIVQALITISWTDPVTIEVFCNSMLSNLMSILIYAFAIGSVLYFAFNCFYLGNDNIHDILTTCVNVPMTLLKSACEQFLNLVFLTSLFFISSLLINTVVDMTGYVVLFNIYAICFPLYFIFITRALATPASNLTMKLIIRFSDPEYKTTILGDAFCFGAAVLSIGSCFYLYFTLT